MLLKSGGSRKWPIALGACVAALAALAVGAVVAQPFAGDDAPQSPPEVQVGAAAQSPTITRDQAIGQVRALAAEVPSDASLTAELLSWGTIRAGQKDLLSVAMLKDDQSLWAVSVSGGYTPAFARGENTKYDWGLVLVDSSTGKVIGALAGNGSPRAPYFDSAADLAVG